MNCYYSNKIEGHNASLVEIELALSGDYERDAQKRRLQAEAKAHIAVQRWIDQGGLGDTSPAAGSSLLQIHDRFFSEFPEPQWVQDRQGERTVLVLPGSYRRDHTIVGDHVPPSPGSIPRFMVRFEKVYGQLGTPLEAILAIAPAHHRLLWIHPFADGNGRVARLMSDAMLSRTLHTYGIWSVSRGLALHEIEYKRLLTVCDQSRRGDLDGRGNLSEKALIEFTAFFLSACLEQVRFMRKVMHLDELGAHIDRWVEDSAAFGDRAASEEKHVPRLHPSAGLLLKAVLDQRVLTLADCHDLLGDDVNVTEVVKQLQQHGVLRQDGEALSFVLTPHRAERFLPGLFP
jgi:Fic family protein